MTLPKSKCQRKTRNKCIRARKSCKYVDKTRKYCRTKKNRICVNKTMQECSTRKKCHYASGKVRSFCHRKPEKKA